MTLDRDAIEENRSWFLSRFGGDVHPLIFYAPGRVNLIGDHTDYNGGLVLPMATEWGTYLFWRPREDSNVSIYSRNLDSESKFDLERIELSGDWSDYPRGVCFALQDHGLPLRGWEGLYFGDLPLEAGLSSSASLELATALALSEGFGPLPHHELVSLSHRAENEFVGVNCGIMDQFASAFCEEDSALLLDCHTREHRHVDLSSFHSTIVIAHTGITRKLSDSPYNERRKECEQALEMVRKEHPEKQNLSQLTVPEWRELKMAIPPPHRNRIEHVVYENVRVREAARYAEEGSPTGFGNMMVGSHLSLRDLYEVSVEELDILHDVSMEQPGVLGSRMTGAGFGGCAVSLVDDSLVASYLEVVPHEYSLRTGREGAFYTTRPGKGMHRMV